MNSIDSSLAFRKMHLLLCVSSVVLFYLASPALCIAIPATTIQQTVTSTATDHGVYPADLLHPTSQSENSAPMTLPTNVDINADSVTNSRSHAHPNSTGRSYDTFTDSGTLSLGTSTPSTLPSRTSSLSPFTTATSYPSISLGPQTLTATGVFDTMYASISNTNSLPIC